MSDFMVWCLDYGQEQEDGMHIKDAFDHRHAATQWASRYENKQAEWPIASGGVVTVKVLRLGESGPLEYFVDGECVPSYSARLRVNQ